VAKDNPFSRLQEEQDAFDAMLDELIVDHIGQFALFRDKRPVGFFPDYNDAYRAGLAKFGTDGVFLVSEVKKREKETPSISWSTGAMFGGT
jgi:hypothetical protein